MRTKHAEILYDFKEVEDILGHLRRRVTDAIGEPLSMSDYQPGTVRRRVLGQEIFETSTLGAAKPPDGGVKYDAGKPMIALIPSIAIEEEAAVYTFGMQKYGMWNWSKGLTYVRLVSAALRHIFAFLRGEELDPESGLPHLSHARCSLGMIRYLQTQNRADLDDRLGKGNAAP